MTLDCTPQALVTTAAPMQAVPDGYQGALLLTLLCTLAGVAADPQALMTRAACLECGLDGMEELVAIDLLRTIAGASSVPNVLANDARCIDCNVPSGFRMEVLLSVACLMAQNGPLAPNDPNVQVFIDTAGITDKPTIDALNKLVGDLKTAGLWSSFDAIYPFVGGTANSNSYNLVNTAKYQITWHGGMTFSAVGAISNGTTGYGDTGFNPITASAPNYALNSATVGAYTRSQAQGSFNPVIGMANAGDNSGTAMYVDPQGGQIVARGPNSANNASSLLAVASGLNTLARTSPVEGIIYASDGSSLNCGNVSTIVQNLNVYVFASNNNGGGVPVGFFSGSEQFAFISSGFTGAQMTALRTAVNTFETSLGRA